jgi:hypothetical protein
MRAARPEAGRQWGDGQSETAGGGRGGKMTRLGHQEAIGGDRESGVMMEAAPAAVFEVAQAQFLFQLLIIALDNPALPGAHS